MTDTGSGENTEGAQPDKMEAGGGYSQGGDWGMLELNFDGEIT